jgi:hypothetical protein
MYSSFLVFWDRGAKFPQCNDGHFKLSKMTRVTLNPPNPTKYKERYICHVLIFNSDFYSKLNGKQPENECKIYL